LKHAIENKAEWAWCKNNMADVLKAEASLVQFKESSAFWESWSVQEDCRELLWISHKCQQVLYGVAFAILSVYVFYTTLNNMAGGYLLREGSRFP